MYVKRNQPHDVLHRSHMMWYVYHELPGTWYEIKQKQHKMPKARANIYVYSSTRFSGLYFEYEKTVPYDMHQKWFKLNELPGMWYQINHIMFFIDLTWYDMYTTNCQVCMWYEIKQKQHNIPKARANIYVYGSTRFSGIFWIRKNCTVWYAQKMIQIEWSARYVIRNQSHYVHDRSHMMWYVYHELPGMWYEIKQKQHKMPKAQANIYVYRSTRFSRLFFEDEKTTPYHMH